MIIQKQKHRARVVKGWSFMNLTKQEKMAIRDFLETGDTDKLPHPWSKFDFSIYTY